MKLQDIDLSTMLKFSPDSGRVLLGDDRMLIFRQDSMGVLRRLLREQLGEALSRSILMKFGYQCGQGDYANMNKNYKWDSDMDRLGAGPTLHMWEGIVHVEVTHLEFDLESRQFHMTGIWRNSYEAELHLTDSGISSEPVCHTLTGYACGWGSSFFGSPLIAIETQCAAMGAPHCVFEARPPAKWGPEAAPWITALEADSFSMTRELERKIQLIEEQALAIRELSTPIMEVWDDVLVLPIVGVVDTKRSAEVMENLLLRIVDSQSKCVIIDITGVEVVDTRTADYLLKVVRAAGLLGTRCVLTGLSPAVAQTLVEIGTDLQEITTLRNLKEGLKDCLRYLAGTNASKPGVRA